MESISNKRQRLSDADVSNVESPAEMKRIRRVSAEDYLLNILDEDDLAESQEIDVLDSVMKSLEQEIRSGTGCETTGTDPAKVLEKSGSEKELGYLLEASDDELGLPPAEDSPANAGVLEEFGDVAKMYEQMWGFDDEIGFGSDFGVFKPDVGDEGFGFEEVGLFDHSEPSDLTWQTMPAV